MENNDKKTLTIEDKIEIATKSKYMSLREIASEYALHHSTVAEIVDESKSVLQKHWEEKSKRIGRPKKEHQITATHKQIEELETAVKARDRELALKSMRIDWLNLQLSWAKEREKEYNIPSRKQLKKKRK